MKKSVLFGLGPLIFMWLASCAAPLIQSETLVASDDVPRAAELKARTAAEKQPVLKATMLRQRVVYVGTEVVRTKTSDENDDPRKSYLVIQYRYDDDTAIHSIVRPADGFVLEQREFPHLATSLGRNEMKAARALAMKAPRVRKELGKDVDRVDVEALVIRAADAKDPWFARRVVRLLFRLGRDYRRSPIVVVDLTNNTVLVETEGNLQ